LCVRYKVLAELRSLGCSVWCRQEKPFLPLSPLGAGQDNLFFVQKYDARIGAMVYSKEVRRAGRAGGPGGARGGEAGRVEMGEVLVLVEVVGWLMERRCR
jgi:hypothetical protein